MNLKLETKVQLYQDYWTNFQNRNEGLLNLAPTSLSMSTPPYKVHISFQNTYGKRNQVNEQNLSKILAKKYNHGADMLIRVKKMMN